MEEILEKVALDLDFKPDKYYTASQKMLRNEVVSGVMRTNSWRFNSKAR